MTAALQTQAAQPQPPAQREIHALCRPKSCLRQKLYGQALPEPNYGCPPLRSGNPTLRQNKKGTACAIPSWWEQRDSNPRPSACKADALNQLSYAPCCISVLRYKSMTKSINIQILCKKLFFCHGFLSLSLAGCLLEMLLYRALAELYGRRSCEWKPPCRTCEKGQGVFTRFILCPVRRGFCVLLSRR